MSEQTERASESEMDASRQERVSSRRRIAVRLGFALMFVASATACIFDRSDYQNGGRLDKGAAAKTAEPEPTTTEDPDRPKDRPPPALDSGFGDAGGIIGASDAAAGG